MPMRAARVCSRCHSTAEQDTQGRTRHAATEPVPYTFELLSHGKFLSFSRDTGISAVI
jgi:hypothetical protein